MLHLVGQKFGIKDTHSNAPLVGQKFGIKETHTNAPLVGQKFGIKDTHTNNKKTKKTRRPVYDCELGICLDTGLGEGFKGIIWGKVEKREIFNMSDVCVKTICIIGGGMITYVKRCLNILLGLARNKHWQ